MLLFHGSNMQVDKPSIEFSRPNLDFGCGFYATSIESQAVRWAHRKSQLSGGTSVINVYEFDVGALQNFRYLEFETKNAEWLDFIVVNRKGESKQSAFDLIRGPVADDRVFEAVNMYMEGLWDKKTTLDALKFYKTNDQYCFTTQRLIDLALQFKHSYTLIGDHVN